MNIVAATAAASQAMVTCSSHEKDVPWHHAQVTWCAHGSQDCMKSGALQIDAAAAYQATAIVFNHEAACPSIAAMVKWISGAWRTLLPLHLRLWSTDARMRLHALAELCFV